MKFKFCELPTNILSYIQMLCNANPLALDAFTQCFSVKFPVWVKSGSSAFSDTLHSRNDSLIYANGFRFSGMCLTAHGSLPRAGKYPVAVPGRNFACRSRLVSCRPLPLAHFACSATGGARFAPHRTVFFSPFRLPSSPKNHIKTGDIRRYLLFLWGG